MWSVFQRSLDKVNTGPLWDCICKYFLPVFGLSFHPLTCLPQRKSFNFDEIQFFIFSSFVEHAFGMTSEKCTYPWS